MRVAPEVSVDFRLRTYPRPRPVHTHRKPHRLSCLGKEMSFQRSSERLNGVLLLDTLGEDILCSPPDLCSELIKRFKSTIRSLTLFYFNFLSIFFFTSFFFYHFLSVFYTRRGPCVESACVFNCSLCVVV